MIPTNNPNKTEKQETRVEPAKAAIRKKEPRHRGTTLPPAIRDMSKLVDALAEEFSFAPTEVGKLKTTMALVIEAWRRAAAAHNQEHQQVRARLNTMFNGRIERWINDSGDTEMKEFFRRVWRP
jgi:hypothetical protein